MTRTTTALTALTALAAGLVATAVMTLTGSGTATAKTGAAVALATSEQVEMTETVEVALSAEQRELVDHAYQRFAAAGLELPPVTIEFPTDDSACYGYGGIYDPDTTTVKICRPSPRTMIHELAHAWTETNLDDTARQAFLDLRGLEVWVHADHPWDRRGAEHAAEIITWAVIDEDITVDWLQTNPDGTTTATTRLFKIPDSSPDQLTTAYHNLTGHNPDIHDHDDHDHTTPDPATVTSPEAL